MLDIIKQHLEAFTAGNWDDYRATLADNAVYDEIATGLRVEGADDFIGAVKRWRTAFPDVRSEIVASVVSGDMAVAEVEWNGTHTGTLEAPFGTIPPTDRKMLEKTALVLKFQNNKIVEARHYFDVLTLMTQLGLAPTMGAPAAEPKGAQAQRPM